MMLNTSNAFFAGIVFLLLMLSCSGKQEIGQPVYITATGNTYHTHSCRYLGENSVPLQVDDAVAKAYSPCSDCIGVN